MLTRLRPTVTRPSCPPCRPLPSAPSSATSVSPVLWRANGAERAKLWPKGQASHLHSVDHLMMRPSTTTHRRASFTEPRSRKARMRSFIAFLRGNTVHFPRNSFWNMPLCHRFLLPSHGAIARPAQVWRTETTTMSFASVTIRPPAPLLPPPPPANATATPRFVMAPRGFACFFAIGRDDGKD